MVVALIAAAPQMLYCKCEIFSHLQINSYVYGLA